MLRLASSLVSKVGLTDKRIQPVTAACRFIWSRNHNPSDYFRFRASHSIFLKKIPQSWFLWCSTVRFDRRYSASNYRKQSVVNHACDVRDYWNQFMEDPYHPYIELSGGANFWNDYTPYKDYEYNALTENNPACDVIYQYFEYRYYPVLFKAFLDETMLQMEPEDKSLSAMEKLDIRRGLEKAETVVLNYLKHRAQKIISFDQIAQFATAAANGDRKIGEIMQKAVEEIEIGGFFFISSEKKSKQNYELEFDNGMLLDWVVQSPYFLTNLLEEICNFRNPLILILGNNELLKENVVQLALQSTGYKRPLLVVAGNLTSEMAGYLMMDWSLQGAKVCVIDSSTYVEECEEAIRQDFAVLTGSQIVTEESDLNFISQMLGSCKEVRATYDGTSIIGGSGCPKNIEKRREQLRSEIKSSTSSCREYILTKRLERLSEVAAVIKVGGASTSAWKINNAKIRTVVRAIVAAVSGGIIPGGGAALLHASKELDKLQVANSRVELGVRIYQRVLKKPMYSIASTAGFKDCGVVENILEQDNPNLGFDPARGAYVDMIEEKIVDPAILVRQELKNALCLLDRREWMHF